MGETDLTHADAIQDIIRRIFSFLDKPVYWLLGLIYQLFFNVATAEIFSGETIMRFYGRVQLILGVFMMFQLALTILRGIMDPNSFVDAKGGAANLIRRIITALVLLIAMTPINISNPSNKWEVEINNNGLIFGTLYSLQYRILSNNTLGRLVLGTDSDTNYFTSDDGDSDEYSKELERSANMFTSTILKSFYRINLLPKDQRFHVEGLSDDQVNINRVCLSIKKEVMDAYTPVDADPGMIIELLTQKCVKDSLNADETISLWDRFLNLFRDDEEDKVYLYAFAYIPVVPAVVGIIFIFVLLSMTVDVAVRAIKLAILRLIAPIPIISYMDPKGSKDSAFNAWVKTTTSTYLDLFIRLAIIYFVIFLIQEMITNGIVIKQSSGLLGVLSMILIWIGLFVFAKQAPKFLREAVGMKGEGGKLFGGLGTIMGMGAAAAGTIGSGIASARASRLADEANDAKTTGFRGFLNRGKHLAAGIGGAAAGGVTGVNAVMNAKDHAGRAALDAMQKRNASVIQKGSAGSTLLGRMKSSVTQFATGDGSAASTERKISTLTDRQKALEAIKKHVSGEMTKYDWTYGEGGDGYTDVSGNSLNGKKFNYKKFIAQMEAARASGSGTVQVTDSTGTSYNISYANAELMKGTIQSNNEDYYFKTVTKAPGYTVIGSPADISAANSHADAELDSLVNDAKKKGSGALTSRRDYKDGAEKLGRDIRDLSRQNAVNKANDRYSGKK